ncbi:hypothetical protein CEUSTIGMA_g9313.t1 [Chlamydomonas eustigma]|uniref:Phospholipase A-2-activating protein n=1 Tax=Chlamydomonas eustigma TaxID=1157962 RepID=A0A250XFN3_9CHLO|nr:hypothetical protein CEUSTIGMA_g9313.t1 [Chlamydomonas eustigma]|eukprot:GAX81885.1 hypothetical protein CEUSTIGMA_g9313.t1 [Chlamydomonas eustigma]
MSWASTGTKTLGFDMSENFHLRSELRGHDDDVRGCMSCDVGIVTASRDKTIKIWIEEGANSYLNMTTLIGHKDFVGPLAFISHNTLPSFPAGAVISGSRDTTVKVWDPTSGTALATCTGHAYQVAAVAVLPSGEVVSASLDKTVRVWRPIDGSSVTVLEGHEGPVLSLAVTPTGEIVSGSGDSTIKLWSGGRCTATLRGHTDTVRALAVFPGLGLVSGSHDLTLRVWDMQGNTLAELLGHTAIIYSVAVHAEKNLIASGSEDGTARLWRPSGECLQVLEHPGCVWDMCFTLEGNLVTGCSDAVARVWTQDPNIKAEEAVLASLTQLLEERQAAIAAKGAEGAGAEGAGALPPGLKVVEPHALLQPGNKDGDTKVVKEANGAVNAYAWDAANFKWEMIGEVVAAPQGQGGAQKMHNGQLWDFVFDVDAEEGAPPKKLPCNRGENPYLVAERFLEQENLPLTYRDQVVQFILQQTAEAGLAGSVNNFPVTGGGVDPFTGGGGVRQSERNPAGGHVQGQLTHVPGKLFLAFDNVPNVEGVGKKLREFNNLLQERGLGLGDDLLSGPLEEILKKLPEASSASSGQAGSAPLSESSMKVLQQLLSWPREQLFPSLDLARALVLDASAAAVLSCGGSLMSTLQMAASEPAIAANQQLGLRLASNCFKHSSTRSVILAGSAQLLDAFSSCCTSTNKAVRLSMSSLLYNFAVNCNISNSGDAELKLQVLSAAIEMLSSTPSEDVDTLFRLLVSIGTLSFNDREMSSVARDLGIQENLRRINDSPEAKAEGGRRLLEAALDIMTIFTS